MKEAGLTLEMLKHVDEDYLVAWKGIGPKTAEKIIEALQEL
jgi:Holliday junction resolvasome RuvABC DNA-binding subunit